MDLLQSIGKTPLIRLAKLTAGLDTEILVKVESRNPGGSIKDRAALRMIQGALEKGTLKPNGTIVEPTSGNTGIGLAAFAAARGYRMEIFLERGASLERRLILQAYGARLLDYKDAIGLRPEAERSHPWQEPEREATLAEIAAYCRRTGAYFNNQAANPANPEAHFRTTGPEIWQDTDGQVDWFVAGVGTGGTITGVGQYLKSKNPGVKVVAVEPATSPVLSKGTAGAHKIQGIGAGFVPDVLDTKVYDEIITVENDDAFATGRLIGHKEGVLVGISSGAAVWAAIQLAKRPENAGKNIVVLLPDTGDRYLSTPLFAE